MILAKDDIEKAVSWWAGKLMDHQPHSNGDDSFTSVAVCFLADTMRQSVAPESLQPLTYNENRDYIDCDEFICHKCGIHVEDWKQIKIDPDDGEKELCEYKFKRCPECGAKVTSHKSCEFCRWHLQDGTCFNKHHSQPVTGREASCWNWEERE